MLAVFLLAAYGSVLAEAAPRPVAAYSFDEGSGSVASDSAGQHDGAIQGATWTSEGKYGSALVFDGVDDLVSVADAAALDLTGSFTLEAWVKPSSLASWSTIVAKAENVSGDAAGYGLSAQGPQAVPAAHLADAGTVKAVHGSAALPTGSWSHVAVTSDGADLRLYIDGELDATAPAIPAAANAADLEIGHSAIFNTYFDGVIDEVRIYDKALTQQQIETDRDNRVEPPAPQEVTTSVLDTGADSELVSSIPITDPSVPDPGTVIYSQEVASMTEGEVLRATANLELTNNHTYDVTDSVRLVLGSDPTDPSGEVVIPWSSVTHTPEMQHWTFPISGAYHATSNLGTQYLKVVAKAQSASAGASDTLVVQQNFGSLAAIRSTPAAGPMSQPTHRQQPQIDPLPELVTSIPVDSNWRRVMTRKIDPLAYDDILQIASQLGVHSPGDATVRLESKITRTTIPSTSGSWAGPLIAEQVSADKPSARIVHTNHFKTTEPEKAYFNLSVRAVPVSGTPSPLAITANSTTLDVLRHEASTSDPTTLLRVGTRVEGSIDHTPDVSSIPYAVGGGSEKRVVASAPLYGGTWKGELIHARGLITGDLAGSTEPTQVLTRLILADSPTATTGQTIGVFSGGKIPPSAQVHTSIKEGVYVMPKAEAVIKYVNFVVYASQANPSGSMDVASASVYLTRSKRTAPIDEGFENGLNDADGIDSVFKYEFNGSLSASSNVAREGTDSLHVDVNLLEDSPFEGRPGIRRVEARPPDIRSAGGYYGEESWHGFSAYFPETFLVPGPDPQVYFDGVIDEVRLYDQRLNESQIADAMKGNYDQSAAPVAAYSFDEGTGSIAVDSVGNQDGTIDGATWTSEGKYGSALDFDGASSVTIPHSSIIDFTSSFTVAAWVRPDTVSAWTGSPVLSKIDNPKEDSSGYLLHAATVGKRPGGLVTNGESLANPQGTAPLPLNEWSHVAMTSDSTDVRLYVDGELVGTVPGVTAVSTESDFTIGMSNYNTATNGTWNIFAQLHHIKDENPLFGCPVSLGGWSPPIAFGVKNYEAGAYSNPGSSEVVTPTEGDYIGIAFDGGEMEEECTPAQGTDTYVIAPLERNRWYDFVLRTRWTPIEGGTDNSVSEVWLDGVQVLGNESTVVSRPTLRWLGTTKKHNRTAYFQFGLYRGPSVEDPPTELYLDAVRSGNEYSQVAPGQ